MDFASLLTVRWDAPYRFLASVVGLTALFVPSGRAGAFGTLAEGSANLSWGWVAVPFGYVDGWIVEYLADGGFSFLVLTGIAAGFVYTETMILSKSRASATVWLFVALSLYTSPLWLVLVALVAGLTVRAVYSQVRRGSAPFHECWLMGALHAAGGLLWAPLVLVSWPVTTPPTRREELRNALQG